MLTLLDCAVLVLAASGFAAGGYLLALRRLASERRRADQAEERTESFLALLHKLSDRKSRASAPGSGLPGNAQASSASLGSSGGTPHPTPAVDSRYLFVSFDEEIRRARERGIPLTLLTLSLENSRAAEPEEYSGTPDRLLRSVAHVARGQMRGCDTCIRYAANAFILILPGVSRDESRRVEGRLRVALQAVAHELRPGVSIRPRASVGSATFPEDGGSFDQLLTLADSRRSQDSGAALPGLPPPASAARYRVPPPALSRN